ncbi:hypothetical protein DPMN_026339 [Dreissena polymorpha]|uniref:Uncharacterized protein n=1 Tax=Dreissena polymorpha TaxID=45954 RepID=A0A9D4RCN0_DREPO|nr:hypothetical protein DPMN_026339 [Dreissena polymorpha]
MQGLLYYMHYMTHDIKRPNGAPFVWQIDLSLSVYIQQGKTGHAVRSHGATEVCLHPSHCRKRPLRCCCRYFHAEQNEKTTSSIG